MDLCAWLECDLDELAACVRGVDGGQVEALGERVLQAQRVFVLGAGRSGLAMRMFALRLMQLGWTVHVVGDATTPAIAPGDLLIVGSASGETAGVATLVRLAREAGAQVAALTAEPDSSIGRMADHCVKIPGSTPKSAGSGASSRLPMASVLEQAYLVVLDCLVAWLAERTRQTDAAMMARHANLE